MPFSCAASSASASWCAIRSASTTGSGPRRHAVGERVAFHQFHDQRDDAARLVHAKDGRDMGMLQGGQEPRLALEPRATLGVVRQRRGQHLDRDIAPQLAVVGPVHLAHPAAAEQREDRERADLLADERAGTGVSMRPATSAAAGVSRKALALDCASSDSTSRRSAASSPHASARNAARAPRAVPAPRDTTPRLGASARASWGPLGGHCATLSAAPRAKSGWSRLVREETPGSR